MKISAVKLYENGFMTQALACGGEGMDGIDPKVRDFIRSLDKEKVGRIVNFGSAAMLNSTWKKVKAEADKVGIPMEKREFHCKGEFKGMHKGRPNAEDLKAAADFARSFPDA